MRSNGTLAGLHSQHIVLPVHGAAPGSLLSPPHPAAVQHCHDTVDTPQQYGVWPQRRLPLSLVYSQQRWAPGPQRGLMLTPAVDSSHRIRASQPSLHQATYSRSSSSISTSTQATASTPSSPVWELCTYGSCATCSGKLPLPPCCCASVACSAACPDRWRLALSPCWSGGL